MSIQSRQAKVFAALVASMTVGAIILMAVGKNPPPAGAFCLSRYYQLTPVEEVMVSRVRVLAGRWKCIQVYYSGAESVKQGQIDLSAAGDGPADINCHFIVCGGEIGGDGQIQATESWQRQRSVYSESSNPGLRAASGEQTIRICVIINGKGAFPTDFQIKRTEALVEQLCRKLDIKRQSIYYPPDWP